MPPDVAARFEAAVERRAAREPYEYIVGEAEFRGRFFGVDRRVLVPRPETEMLVDATLALGLRAGAALADLGTGSGCIAISLALERPDLAIWAVDLSEGALAVARDNAARHGASDRVRFVHGDLGSQNLLPPGTLDAIVSNPPYVPEAEWRGLEPEVRDHEPREALVPGPTGGEAYATIARASREMLVAGGVLVLELGYRSRDEAAAAIERAGLAVATVRDDPRGIPRVLVARNAEGGGG